jgi:hypothetical protein
MKKQNKNKIAREWIKNNGCADFDFKKRDVILWDGGLFSIVKEKVMRQKVTGFKKLPNGMSQIIFSKKKYPVEDYKAIFWFEELDDSINYFKRMKKMLNSLGYKTYRKIDRK